MSSFHSGNKGHHNNFGDRQTLVCNRFLPSQLVFTSGGVVVRQVTRKTTDGSHLLVDKGPFTRRHIVKLDWIGLDWTGLDWTGLDL